MGTPVKVAIDAMGGDAGPTVYVPAAQQMLASNPLLELTLVGQQDIIKPLLNGSPDRLKIVNASEVVAMDEPPADALRKKKDSSLRVAIDLVKNGKADACVSAGNTGALMATARFVLKTLPGIERPAIMSGLPTIKGHAHMLDLGANSGCTSDQLFQFAVMGSVVINIVENISSPRIGLLNIGSEGIKGNDTIRQAALLLEESDLNYIGFVEGTDISRHKADVIVCDGFSGNIALKSMEGTAHLVRHFMKQEFKNGLYGRFAALVSLPILRSLARSLDPRRYNGASLVGLNGIVIKSHGSADIMAFKQAIHTAIIEVDKNLPEKIHQLLVTQEH
ncbi:MAG: phosphate acyltransferase PlsX [Gammaproteobacteria bacterium]|nr:phosphate acyltransferase PlsX [Gammaproteobacteria bacterium]MCP4088761.1 phosphate acyltransferase PlsX [Gammaproteobacteria bacterium]MCP4275940.1 phosphate acyltransferase PlsX [Gammaproteobacteria bacterium]MCP4832156.1 phosphate acyltransferase PlsX [Gammaproteobacteria bacterium]MCP4928243.1 phosphate acyltransferase PlsX [Gammaproteobacteria bacterium]